jgi:hypothetical protein
LYDIPGLSGNERSRKGSPEILSEFLIGPSESSRNKIERRLHEEYSKAGCDRKAANE